jgi:hypothetical protein
MENTSEYLRIKNSIIIHKRFEPVPVTQILRIGDVRMRLNIHVGDQDVRMLYKNEHATESGNVSIKPQPTQENFKVSRRKCA